MADKTVIELSDQFSARDLDSSSSVDASASTDQNIIAMAVSINSLIAQQRMLFSSLDRTYTSLDLSTPPSASQLSGRISYLKLSWTQCKDNHMQIATLMTEEDQVSLDYFKEDLFGVNEMLVLSHLDELQERLDQVAAPLTSSPLQASRASGFVNLDQSFRSTKLPPIGLPQFSGDFSDWVEFRDYFESLIINDPQNDDLHKLHYLKTCLTGEAALLLKNTSTNLKNFSGAWRVLTDRYENKRRLINVHFSNLWSIEPVSHASASKLQALLDATNDSITALKNLDLGIEHWDEVLVFMTVRRLDKATLTA